MYLKRPCLPLFVNKEVSFKKLYQLVILSIASCCKIYTAKHSKHFNVIASKCNQFFQQLKLLRFFPNIFGEKHESNHIFFLTIIKSAITFPFLMTFHNYIFLFQSSVGFLYSNVICHDEVIGR